MGKNHNVVELFDPVRGGSEPNRYWTRTNTAEATPDLLKALEWDVFGTGLEEGFIRSMVDFGVLAKGERVVSDDPNERMTSVFYGRQAVNVDLLRLILARLPGLSPDNVERDLLGSVRPGLAKEPSAPLRMPIIAYKLPRQMLGLERRVRRLYAEQLRWWQTEVFDVYRRDRAPGASAIDRLERASTRYANAFTVHSIVRWLLPVAEKIVHDLAEKVGRADLIPHVLAGHGELTEMALARHIWAVGTGDRSLESFLREYGFHGPRTGNLSAHSWREQPEYVERLAQRMHDRTDLADPVDRERAARAEHARAVAELLKATPPARRALLRFGLARAAGLTRKLELGKAAYLMGLDGARLAARDLGTELADLSVLKEPEDVFFLTRAELRQVVSGDLPDPAALVAYRREQREMYENGDIPITFTGDPVLTVPETAVATDAATGAAIPTVVELSGAAAGGGVVRGRARIVLDSNEEVEFEQDDILVCRFSDPSWTPLFLMASGVVIDIGSFSSHGAVVARELGIPYVIGTGDGTTKLREKDLIEVDGERGVVRRLGPPASD